MLLKLIIVYVYYQYANDSKLCNRFLEEQMCRNEQTLYVDYFQVFFFTHIFYKNFVYYVLFQINLTYFFIDFLLHHQKDQLIYH